MEQAPIQMRIKPPKPNRPTTTSANERAHNHVPSSKIKKLNRALKGHAKSYGIELQDNLNLLNHFTKTKVFIESHLEDLLKSMKGFKFIETLEVTFKKINNQFKNWRAHKYLQNSILQ